MRGLSSWAAMADLKISSSKFTTKWILYHVSSSNVNYLHGSHFGTALIEVSETIHRHVPRDALARIVGLDGGQIAMEVQRGGGARQRRRVHLAELCWVVGGENENTASKVTQQGNGRKT